MGGGGGGGNVPYPPTQNCGLIIITSEKNSKYGEEEKIGCFNREPFAHMPLSFSHLLSVFLCQH